MLFAFALLPAAHAYTVLCSPYVAQTLPAPGALYVPLDVRPLAIFDGESCRESWGFEAELLDADGAVVAASAVSVSGPDDGPRPFISVESAAELLPNAAYILRITPTLGGAATEVGFTTGEGYAEAVGEWPPTLTLSAASRDKAEGWWTLSAMGVVSGEPDVSGFSSLFVMNEDGQVVEALLPDAAGLAQLSTQWTAAESGPSLCLSAVQADGAGVEGVVSEPRCARAERRLCSASPSAGRSALAVVLGVLLMRRRSR